MPVSVMKSTGNVLPQDTGGKPISHYVVEKKAKKSGKWSPVAKFCHTPQCEINDLNEGEEYEFRVAVVNDQGQSEPLITLKPIIAKHPFDKFCSALLYKQHLTLIKLVTHKH